MKGLNVMVVGGCGFVGSHLVDGLITAGANKITIVDDLFLHKNGQKLFTWANPKVQFINCDASNRDKMKFIFSIAEIQIVFNLAVKPLPHSLIHPIDNFNNNVGIVSCLLDLLEKKYFEKLLHFSSSEVYGSCQVAPMDENHPKEPSTIYAASKKTCDDLVMCYHKLYNCHTTILRPFNLYGPRQNKGSYAGVIPKTLDRLISGQRPQIYGDGSQTRDYTYVSDVIRAAILMANNWDKVNGETFVVASGMETSVLELITKIMRVYKGSVDEGSIEFLNGRRGDVHRHIGCAYKIEDVLGFKPEIFLDSGLYETIKWYIDKEK